MYLSPEALLFPTAVSVPDCSTVHLQAVTFLVLPFTLQKVNGLVFLAHKGIEHYKAIYPTSVVDK